MSAPRQVNDGNFKLARQHGATSWEFPFAHEGDATAWVATITMRQDQAYFRPLAPMTRLNTVRGVGYLVSPEDVKDIGQGRVEWQRIVANIPAKRTVPGGNGMLNIQTLVKMVVPGEPATYESEEIPLPKSTQLTYEYAISPLPLLAAPRILIFNQSKNYVLLGGWRVFKPGEMVLVNDSEHSLYRGLIYCRMTTRAAWPANLAA